MARSVLSAVFVRHAVVFPAVFVWHTVCFLLCLQCVVCCVCVAGWKCVASCRTLFRLKMFIFCFGKLERAIVSLTTSFHTIGLSKKGEWHVLP